MKARRDVEALLFRQAIPSRIRLMDPCGEEALLLHKVQDKAGHGHILQLIFLDIQGTRACSRPPGPVRADIANSSSCSDALDGQLHSVEVQH